MNRRIASELIKLAQHDLELRERLIQDNKLFGGGYNPEMEAVHRANAARLREIIAEIGWPTRSTVGDEASEAAWLIVQHAIGEPRFTRQCYAMMLESSGDINPQNLAYMYDRICYFEGRPQRYGTQYDDGGMYPVEDKSKVNKLRMEVGMKPQPEAIIREYRAEDDQGDLHTDAEFNAWRKKVGWIK